MKQGRQGEWWGEQRFGSLFIRSICQSDRPLPTSSAAPREGGDAEGRFPPT